MDSLVYRDPQASLASWVMNKVEEWEDHRNTNYMEKWDEYYRIWRGIWSYEDKTRESENSKLISPATQQAIESTVAELEEAIFGRDMWFDIRDDVADQNPTDIAVMRAILQEDMKRCKVKDSIVESLLSSKLLLD